MAHVLGGVRPDGSSVLPAGITDTSEGADDIVLDPEIQRKIDSILGSEINEKARYKLEVAFTQKRSVHRPYIGVVTAWSNGGYDSGGGDEAVYFCPTPVEKNGQTRTCSSPIDLKWIGKNVAVCPSCNRAVKPVDLAGQIIAKLYARQWAELLVKMWATLGCDADIRMGLLKGDLRRVTNEELSNKKLGGDSLRAVRSTREWAIYPLRNILKDTSTGANLATRIYAFLNS